MNTEVNDAVALVKHGLQLAGQLRLDDAVASFDRAIALKPDFAEALIIRGIVLFDLGRFEDAVASYDRVLALKPDAEAFHCRGAALYNLERLEEAVASYDRALALKPDAEGFNTRGMALYKLDRLEEAVASYDGALALKPDAEVYTRRGAALYDLGRLEEAVASYDGALALQPDYVEALNSRGVALADLGRLDDALASYGRALASDPGHAKTHFNRSLALLRVGDLARGFEAYRWRFQANAAPASAFACPGWEGEPIAGKRLVILHEQGFGDTLQFVRYVPMAQARGAHVTLLVEPALLRLMQTSLPGVEVIDRVPDGAVFDYQAPMLCLPRIFGTTLETIPADIPYLAADPAAAAAWSRRLAALPGLKVGLVWAGGKKLPSADARRSLSLAQFAPLAAIAGIQFVSLQIGLPAAQAKTPPAGLSLVDWTGEIRDYADTAALVAGLDLVITVDTSVAHLAGGLGKPVWILSRFDGCWRWLMDREDSPWYPAARLFHQPAMGAWEPVMAKVAAALKAFSSRDGDPSIAPDPHRAADAAAFVNQGLQWAGQQRFDEAVTSFDRAISLKPDFVEALHNRGTALYRLNRFEEAVASYDGALALEPDAQAFSSRGLALYHLRRLDEAVASYDGALAIDPDHAETRLNRALALLRAGDLPRGFEAYRWRFRINGTRPALACPDWEGEPIAGKRLVIFHEQGGGDTLQFVRYAPMALALGAQVTLLVPTELLRLLRASLPGIEVVDRVPASAVFDYQAPMLCLPRIFGTTLQTIPADIPYLAADPAAAAAWSRRLAALPGLKVGLVWAGGSGRSYDERRSLKLAQLAPLAAVPGVRFVSLQIGEPSAEAKTPPAGLRLVDWTGEIRDYADTAALAANLDLVITIDTSVAHLAGALGRPVWILSRFDGCWRWLTGRDDSPWYPTARLFHQAAMGQWEPVIAQVATALRAFASQDAARVLPHEAGQAGRTDAEQAELNAILASYAEAPALAAEQLEGSAWAFFDLSGRLLSPSMALAPQGRLENPGTAATNFWRIAGGQLCLATDNGAPSVIFKLARKDETGRIISFAGQGVIDGIEAFYFLRAAVPQHQAGDAVAFVKQGFQLAAQQRFDAAVSSFDQAIALKPDFAEALISRGIALACLGRFEDAVASYDRVLAGGPDADALNNRGIALASLGRFDEAQDSIDRAIALGSGSAEACRAVGVALHDAGRFEDALACHDRALALKPDAETFNRRGEALHDLGRPDAALASYDRALALDPDHAGTHYNRAVALLRMGDLARGFEALRWRFRRSWNARPAFACPDWEGEPIAGKRLVIFTEYGYGDTLQFVRYVPMALARGATITLFAQPALVKLLRASLPGVEVVEHLPSDAVFDYQAPMLCLPRIFGTTLETIPADIPYLAADPAAAAAWSRRLAALPGLKVGLAWAGRKELSFDVRRSLKLAQFAPLAAVPGIQFVSLQIGESAQEAKAPPAGLGLVDWTNEIGDFADTAALVAGLDLVITVDTSVAHLAGALGKPVWILSRYDGCWRWLMGRSDSPWYPTARLFRQPAVGAWEPVMADIAAALQAFAPNEPSRIFSHQEQHMDTGHQAELKAILASYTEAPALAAEQLEGSSWKFFDLNGRLLSPAMGLAPQGQLQNPGMAAVDRWQIVDGQLCLMAGNGAPSVILKLARKDETGRIISLAGQGVIDGIEAFYFLRLA